MTRSRRVLLSLVVLLAGVLAGVLVGVPGANGAYLAKLTNSTDSAGTATYFTCQAAALGESGTKATFAWPLNEDKGTTAADIAGTNTGTFSASGVTYAVASTMCPRDTDHTVVTLDGTAGYVVAATTSQANPTTFTEELWFRTTTATGKLMGFGSSNSATGTTSGNYDRHIYFDSTGVLRFGVYTGSVQTIASAAGVNYADGNWHYAAASQSSGGMKLWVDGKLVASNSAVTGAENYTGYWHVGFDNLSGWTNPPSSNYFKGSVARAAVYGYALTDTQVAAHYRSGV